MAFFEKPVEWEKGEKYYFSNLPINTYVSWWNMYIDAIL